MRPATAADIPAVLALYADPDLDGDTGLGVEEATAIFESFAAYPSYVMYVAVEGGAVVGTYCLMMMRNIAHRGAWSGIVESVAVAAEARGRGIGAAMMRHAVEVARARGCYKLALSSNLRRTRAHSFYERLGFEQHGLSFLIDPREAPWRATS